jgi:pyruvate/2-oxoglutarate dehydrogenase complex dihydrolipoamide acyltransferase (E2) component
MTGFPAPRSGHLEVRDVLDRTVSIDHNVVDGAPATHFAADLRETMRIAAVLARKAGG